MGTANKDRQAAFKTRMRAAGKKQLTVWVDRYQEQAIRDLLAGGPLCYPEQGADDARAERERLIAAREHSLDQRELKLQNREQELERQLRPSDAAATRTTSTGHAARVSALVKAFTTDSDLATGESRQVSSPFMAKIQSDLIADLARKTTTVKNGLAVMLQEFGTHGILSDADAAPLSEAHRLAGEIGQAVTDARQIVARFASKLEEEEAKHKRDAFAAVRQRFGTLGAADAVLVTARWAPLDLPSLFNGLYALNPGDPAARHRIAQLTESARDTLVRQVADVTRSTAEAAKTALARLIGDLEAHKPTLMQQHGSLIRRLNACLAADALARTA